MVLILCAVMDRRRTAGVDVTETRKLLPEALHRSPTASNGKLFGGESIFFSPQCIHRHFDAQSHLSLLVNCF